MVELVVSWLINIPFLSLHVYFNLEFVLSSCLQQRTTPGFILTFFRVVFSSHNTSLPLPSPVLLLLSIVLEKKLVTFFYKPLFTLDFIISLCFTYLYTEHLTLPNINIIYIKMKWVYILSLSLSTYVKKKLQLTINKTILCPVNRYISLYLFIVFILIYPSLSCLFEFKYKQLNGTNTNKMFSCRGATEWIDNRSGSCGKWWLY